MQTETVELQVELAPKEAAALRRLQRDDPKAVAKALAFEVMRRGLLRRQHAERGRNESGGPI